MPTADIFSQDLVVTSGTQPIQDVVQTAPQQEKINVFNNTNYSQAPNAVKLLPVITNNGGKIKLYTEINSNIRIGDKIFIMFNPSGTTSGMTDGVILDNYLEFSGCTNYIYLPQLQGYTVIEINDNNNEITIDRYYDDRFVNKKIYDHCIAEIYIRNIILTGGEIDGAEIINASFNTSVDAAIDINLVQAVLFSGVSFFMRHKDKYDNLYITTNSSINTGSTVSVYKPYVYKGTYTLNQDPTPVSSYYTNNNKNYGYNYIYYNHLHNCQIDNGYYDNCVLTECIINGGSFTNSEIKNSTINGGIFYNTFLDSDCYWFNGIWSGGTFTQDIWYNGVWKSGSFIGKEWRDGVFNNGIFSGSTWRTGLFQDGTMSNSIWSGGTFSGGNIINTEWIDGKFNGGNMTQCNWYNGTCNGGSLLNTNWINGTCYDGTLTDINWVNGIFNGGRILNSYWNNGTFNGGVFNSGNNASSISGETINYSNTSKGWNTGTFNGGVFSNSVWSGGTFNDGTFTDSSLWYDGIFRYGTFTNSNWLNGNFKNGTVNNSYFHNVDWETGIWNSGTLGVQINNVEPTISWSGGTFNNGTFGHYAAFTYINWYSGDFYGGSFYNGYVLSPFNSFGGFYNGTFHEGNFYGVFWGGVWVTGIFGGHNMTSILTNRTVKTNYINNRVITKKYGELPLKAPQQNVSNL